MTDDAEGRYEACYAELTKVQAELAAQLHWKEVADMRAQTIIEVQARNKELVEALREAEERENHWKRKAEQAHDVIEEFSEGLRTLEAERNKAQGRAMVHAITIGQLRDVLELVRPTIAKEHRELADKVLAKNGGQP